MNGNINLFNYKRRQTCDVKVAQLGIGSNYPIRIQTMTTTQTANISASVSQVKSVVNAGAELVRLTTQGTKEAECMKEIKAKLGENFTTPLVADVHFNPKVAEVAAIYCDKVRINPGNYIDPARTFKHLEYTDLEYKEELLKLEKRFMLLLNICKNNNTALRIGVNHGSLSDRIMSRFGNTPSGIVESCMEFLRVCNKVKFHNVVVSIKASNVQVMVQSVRLLVATMQKEGMNFPLHLGVTEAGEGEGGRIKSALGIGSLLADGIGDTVRVSLSENPEAEIPAAKTLVNVFKNYEKANEINADVAEDYCFTNPQPRKTFGINGIGGEKTPIVIATQTQNSNLAFLSNKPDYIYIASQENANINPNCNYITDYNTINKYSEHNIFPLFTDNQLERAIEFKGNLMFIEIDCLSFDKEKIEKLKHLNNAILIANTSFCNKTAAFRAFVHKLLINKITLPVVFKSRYSFDKIQKNEFQIHASANFGAVILDGFCNGIWLENNGDIEDDNIVSTSFSILQAGRLRSTKTEFISCPGCGRTLFNLQDSIARVKTTIQHIPGLRLAIMGCIVNGPGEMADAHYGYVGAGKGKVSLYRGKECVEKNISEDIAPQKLLDLIKQDGLFNVE